MRKTAVLGAREIARRRLVNQRLIGEPFADPVEVVKRLGAVQSQDYPGGKWGIAQRTPRATDADVERALGIGAILRTHVLRPTWHFVAAGDIRWMLALTAPRLRSVMAPYDRHLDLDDKVFAKSARAITKALTGGKELTRTELRGVLERANLGAISSQRLGHLMMRAELDALVCSGVRQGKQATYALFEERVPAAPTMERDESLSELATRYFTTRGPASVHDFAWWSGLTVGDARRGVEAIQSRLEQQTVGGRVYWFTDASTPARSRAPSAHLLPNYDEYFIGHKDRSAIGDLVKTSGVNYSHDAFTAHVIVIDGQLVGGWKRGTGKRATVLELHLVVKLDARQMRAIEEQARRYGEFIGAPVELAVAKAPGIRRIGSPPSFGPRFLARSDSNAR